jgi:hypothetical protein
LKASILNSEKAAGEKRPQRTIGLSWQWREAIIRVSVQKLVTRQNVIWTKVQICREQEEYSYAKSWEA